MTRAIPFAVAVLATLTASAATVPPGFVDTVLFNAIVPTGLAYEPGSGNMFVLEKGGGVGTARVLRRAVAGGTVTTALTLSCLDYDGERGLLGIAFDPDYLQNASTRWVYLYYTRLSPESGACSIPGSTGSRNRVVRFKEAGGVLSGEELLLEGPVLTFAKNHNGGTLRFAPDKTLFVSIGDNSTDTLPLPLARDLSDLRGKILRLNRDGTPPVDNPFVGQAGVRAEIWAWGLRNPFRFSIDADGTPWIADVGEQRYEEIDRGLAGADFGWPCFEANDPFRSCTPPPANPIAPTFVYGHTVGTAPFAGATVIGGPVYRNGNFPPSYNGRLFFGDYVDAGWIRSAAIDPGGTLSDVQLFIPDAGSLVDIVQAPNGCLGWVEIYSGNIHETCFVDADYDGVGNTSDNCVADFNPSQSDFNQDGEGDRCDLNDGLIYVYSVDENYREWQAESGYMTWNSYRGSLGVLRGTGAYTQAPGSNPLADRDCGLIDPHVLDLDVPAPGAAAFHLVTGVTAGVESGLRDEQRGGTESEHESVSVR